MEDVLNSITELKTSKLKLIDLKIFQDILYLKKHFHDYPTKVCFNISKKYN